MILEPYEPHGTFYPIKIKMKSWTKKHSFGISIVIFFTILALVYLAIGYLIFFGGIK